ncbi:MAG: hypothetical protein WC841_02245 [Candidatus Shapirobacteria bacterium]|jgi:hypothetical protein
MKIIPDLNSSQTLSIISIPVVGYIAAFCYLTGKYTFLNLPVIFVEVNTETAILSSLLVLFVLAVLMFSFFLSTKSPNKKEDEEFKPLTKKNLIFAFVAVLAVFIIFTYLILSISILLPVLKSALILFIFLLLIIYIFVIPLFQYPNEKSYLSKYNLYSEKIFKANLANKEKKKDINVDISFITKFLRINYVFYPAFIIIWTLLSYGIGYSDIQSQTKFPISTINDESYIIAGKYNGDLLLVNVDIKNNIILNKIILKPMDETLMVQQKDIGKLNQIK